MSASVIFGVVGGVRNRGNDDNIALDQELLVDENEPDIEVPEGATAFKIEVPYTTKGYAWTYSSSEMSWSDYLSTEANTLNLDTLDEGSRVGVTISGVVYTLCSVDAYGESPVDSSDIIQPTATYALVNGG
ncbi:MAG: hypothetical protein E7339_00220 [Clostridiales bacterium]|nr:hypothetical protein [Clostridiales bacterium]